MSDIIDTVQLQETDDALITLFEVTLPSTGTVVYLVDGMDNGENNIYFPEKQLNNSSTYTLQEYVAIPIDVEGVEFNSSGSSNRPTLRLANIPVLSRTVANNEDGVEDEYDILDILAEEGIVKNEDLLTAKVVIRRTLFKKTYTESDAPTVANAPVEFPTQVFYIDRVSSESNVLVEFELATAMDIETVKLPGRVINGRYCPWKYQGYHTPVTVDDAIVPLKEGGCTWPINSKGRFFDEHDNVITRDITTIALWESSNTFAVGAKVKTITNGHTEIWEALRAVPSNKNPKNQKVYWKRLDVCGKTLNSCKIRFQGNNTTDALLTTFTLPFGGFPGSKQFR